MNHPNEEHRYTETHVSVSECECRVCGKREPLTEVTIIELEVPSEKLISWECSNGHHNHVEIFAGDANWTGPDRRT